MPNSAICGYSGSTSISDSVVRWEATVELDMHDISGFASAGAADYLGCLKSASGSFSTLTPDAAPGLNLAVEFTNAEGTLTADIIITSAKTSVDAKGLVTYDYEWESTGEVTWA